MLAARPPLAILAAAALALAALAVALAAPGAAAPRAEAAAGETITTRLYPGWNMVGWVGPDADVRELFVAVPDLLRVAAWETDAGTYRQAWQDGSGDLSMVGRGAGLWLYLASEHPFEWERPASPESLMLSLRTGRNLVGWTGDDGTLVDGALKRFGDAFERAWRWDAAAQRFERYPASGEGETALAALRRGDALLMSMSSDVRWWQPGTERPRFVFAGDYANEDRRHVRELLESARAVFAERFGAYTAEFEVTVGWTRCGGGTAIFLTDWCATSPWVIAHEYFHVLQWHAGRGFGEPAWLVEGSANYAHYLYTGVVASDSTVDTEIQRAKRFDIAQVGHTTAELSDIETNEEFRAADTEDVNYRLGFLAADWLVSHTSERALVEFFRLLPSFDSWELAFQHAFGISLDDFYAAFEAYRAEVAPPLPHLTDEVIKPIGVFLGTVPVETQTRMIAELDGVHRFFTDRLAAEPTEYTAYVSSDNDAARLTVARLNLEGFFDGCAASGRGFILYIITCDYSMGYETYIAQYLTALLYGTVHSGPPLWLQTGILRFVTASYREANGLAAHRDLDEYLDLAGDAPVALDELASGAGWAGVSRETVDALSFLAVRWLAQHAGERALIEYYRNLPPSPPRWQEPAPWQPAFEQAFGLTIGEFYQRFEAYRAALTLP